MIDHGHKNKNKKINHGLAEGDYKYEKKTNKTKFTVKQHCVIIIITLLNMFNLCKHKPSFPKTEHNYS